MDKNYYEILEIDRKASPEIIKKSYNTLAKKYHPDLQPEDLKATSEEKFKLINEAYETLSVPEKRAEYDSSLAENSISKEDYDAINIENEKLKNIIQQMKNAPSGENMAKTTNTFYNNSQENINNAYTNAQSEQQNYYNEYMNNIEQARQKAYHDAYIQDLKNRGYKIKYKKTFKEYFTNFVALVCTIFILFILWQIPFIRNIFVDAYNENKSLQYFVNFFINIFK